MLVFRRQAGESFMIGGNVEVRILRVARGHVKVGVIAPREVDIVRTEISRLNRQAAIKEWSAPHVTQRLKGVADRLRGRSGAE